jgi:CubicO group peptidase (beta-lactamase class C family)
MVCHLVEASPAQPDKNCRMKKIAEVLFGFYFLVIPHLSRAQELSGSALTKHLDELLAEKFQPATPGVAILVARQGQVIYKKTFGSADLELNVPLQPDMVFSLGSITKQFTAIAILQLMEQGKLSLQDSLQKYVPDFPSKGYKITIENLLTHTSGIKDYLQIDYPEPFMERRDYRPKQLIDSFKTFPLDFEPGTAFRYSNSGYYLLGYIVEKISGKSFQNYIQENLLIPLGLNHTYLDTDNVIIPGRVNGYTRRGPGFRNANYWSTTITWAAGGLISNVEDLFKWHKGLFSYKIIKKQTLEKAFLPFKLKNGKTTGYGYGWFIKNIGGFQSIEHSGAITGFLSNEIYFPAEDIFIATLYNCDCTPKDELAVSISGLVLGKPLQKNIPVNESILNDYPGTYALMPDAQRLIVIVKEKDYLLAKVQGEKDYPLLFQSESKFEFKNIVGVACEFIRENGKVIKFVLNQNGLFEWKKIK